MPRPYFSADQVNLLVGIDLFYDIYKASRKPWLLYL